MIQVLFAFFYFSVSQVASAAPAFVDAPRACFSTSTYPCSVRVEGGFLAFQRGEQKYHLGENSSLLFDSAKKIKLLEGVLWIRESRGLQILISPALSLEADGEIFLDKKGHETHVRNLSGAISFQSQNVFAHEALPVGFQNWYGPMDAKGEVSRGLMRPILMNEFLKLWIPISGLSLAEVKRQTSLFRESWKPATELSASFYRDIVERRIASQEEGVRRVENRKMQALREQAQLRRMFRQKNGLEPQE